MKKRNLTIKVPELPKRSERISLDALTKVFGGCKHGGDTCKKQSECCTHLCALLFFVPVCSWPS